MYLRDPSSGVAQSVTQGGMASEKAICLPYMEYINRQEEQAYNAVISVTPTGAGDCFFYFTNDNVADVIVSSLRLQSASAENVQVKLGDSGTVGGTHAALTPVNLNAGSGKVADVTCESGVDITGLSGGSIVDEIVAGATMLNWEWSSGLILPKKHTLSLYAVTGAVALKAILSFCFMCSCLDV